MISLYYKNEFNGRTEVTYSFEDSDLYEILDHFTYFLRACSYTVDGLRHADEDDIILTPGEYREALNDEHARAITEYIERRAGWIPWEGGDRSPAHKDTQVEVRYHNGATDSGRTDYFSDWDDIVAYRVIEPSGCYTEHEIRNAFDEVDGAFGQASASTLLREMNDKREEA